MAPNIVVFFFNQYANAILGSCNGLRSYQPTSCGCQGSVFLEWTIYTKPANKGITLNYQSHHLSSTKLAVTTNEFNRTLRCSSEEHVEDAVQTTRERLTANGYPAHVLDRSYSCATKRGKEEKKKKDGKEKKKTPALTLRIPFVSDQINHQIQRTLAKHDVPARVVNPRGKTIDDLVKCPARNGSVKHATVRSAQHQACASDPGQCGLHCHVLFMW